MTEPNEPKAPAAEDAPDILVAPLWRPLTAAQRRVAGALIEKAKTTPENYPMTLNAITTACNQKNNRHPVTDYDAESVRETLDQLRDIGAVVEVQALGRVPKYRHKLYEWFGVDKVELAVMGELLLRGPQTVGELRGRASRMEPIADLHELKPILQRLIDRQLVRALTPEGRGQMVTHNLYLPSEKPAAAAEDDSSGVASWPASGVAVHADSRPDPGPSRPRGDQTRAELRLAGASSAAADASPEPAPSAPLAELQSLRAAVAELADRLARLESRVANLES